MRRQKSGKIINIASGTVFAGAPGRIHYVTSKAATIGFTRTLAREVGEDNITSTASPRQHAVGRKSDRANDQVSRIIRRLEIDKANSTSPRRPLVRCLFLASPLSDFITGQTINVDGVNIIFVNWSNGVME
jgi:3-oxoacyl-[acyl-carrier protein] reductase